MKKIFLILMLFVSVLLTGCSNSSLEVISFETLKAKINNKESFVVYFSDNEKNILETRLSQIKDEYNITAYKVNTTKISSNERLEFQTIVDYETPSIVFVIEGLDSSKLSHITNTDTTKKQIIARLKDMNFIKEN